MIVIAEGVATYSHHALYLPVSSVGTDQDGSAIATPHLATTGTSLKSGSMDLAQVGRTGGSSYQRHSCRYRLRLTRYHNC